MLHNRLLLYLVPDKPATLIAGTTSLVAFALGVLEMITRDFDSAGFHLNLSVGIMGALFVLKFLGMRATYQVAEHAQRQVHQHIRSKKAPPQPTGLSPEETRAQEKRHLAELADSLSQALTNIAPDSPVRPKYEATLELIHRMAQH
jgi:hypothetical protein